MLWTLLAQAPTPPAAPDVIGIGNVLDLVSKGGAAVAIIVVVYLFLKELGKVVNQFNTELSSTRDHFGSELKEIRSNFALELKEARTSFSDELRKITEEFSRQHQENIRAVMELRMSIEKMEKK